MLGQQATRVAYFGLFMAILTNTCKDGPLNADWGCQVEIEPLCVSRSPRAIRGSLGGTACEQLLSDQQQGKSTAGTCNAACVHSWQGRRSCEQPKKPSASWGIWRP